MLTNSGLLIEGWICNCAGCGKEVVVNWDDGRNMSQSQAKHVLINELGWSELDGVWVCGDCKQE